MHKRIKYVQRYTHYNIGKNNIKILFSYPNRINNKRNMQIYNKWINIAICMFFIFEIAIKLL